MEASPEQSAEGLALVQVLATVLDRLVGANILLARSDPGQVTKFHAMKPPGISILQYLERYVKLAVTASLFGLASPPAFLKIFHPFLAPFRIHKYASCSNECFILALIYIDRLIQSNNFLLTELNAHRVVITAVLLAAKFFDDAYYNNAYYAKVGGVLVSEMNGLEVDFLFRINFTLHVTPEVFAKYRGELVAQSQTVAALVQPPVPTMMQAYPQPMQVPVVNPQQPPFGDDQEMDTMTNYHPMQQTAPHITPSPPAGAAKMMHDAANNGMQYTDPSFMPIYRSNSMPEPAQLGDPSRSHAPVPQRCAQSSLAAPVGGSVQFTSVPYNPQRLIQDHEQLVAAMSHQILPLQEGLAHHHHGMYVPQKATDPRLQPC
jgi:hypothetical protein